MSHTADYSAFSGHVREVAKNLGINLGTISFSGPGLGEKGPTKLDLRINQGSTVGKVVYSEHQKKVLDILGAATEIYAERSSVYKDNYKAVGRVMEAMFPDGAPKLQQREDYDRWHIFELMIVKLTRYSNNYDVPHQDSLDDLLVYSAILGALDRELHERLRSEKEELSDALDVLDQEDDLGF